MFYAHFKDGEVGPRSLESSTMATNTQRIKLNRNSDLALGVLGSLWVHHAVVPGGLDGSNRIHPVLASLRVCVDPQALEKQASRIFCL